MSIIASNVAGVIGMLTVAAALVVPGVGSIPPDVESPFFCNLKALTAAERSEHLEHTKQLMASLQETREVADGYAFVLDPHRLAITDLAAWIDRERRCCPFFDFRIEWKREHGPLVLQLTGRDGVKTFMRAEFAPAFR